MCIRDRRYVADFTPTPERLQEMEEIVLRINAYLGYDFNTCLLYTSPSPRDRTRSRLPSSA